MVEPMAAQEREPGGVPDDYLIEHDPVRHEAPFGLWLIQFLRVILVLVLAAVSLALFWLIGSVIGLF
jgi:hypothetical protein